MYDVNKQCELMFGLGSQVCPYLKQCKRLWCTSTEGVHKGCRTQHMPLADGTVCGVGMTKYEQCETASREIQIGIRKRFFTEKLAGHWNRLLREVVTAPTLAEFKEHLDDALSHMV
ncbi:hypothetical protein QYF61_006460 [Mycteria americana]|uniref:ADAMTS cysteine-rich domain-containing protein n=1 Tax=Mycteria americana TaxID=33587 RepID=A0AAN7NRN7_MYCAM|nr:hypothetical protein QYF61_006460 [Mycteria americana]